MLDWVSLQTPLHQNVEIWGSEVQHYHRQQLYKAAEN